MLAESSRVSNTELSADVKANCFCSLSPGHRLTRCWSVTELLKSYFQKIHFLYQASTVLNIQAKAYVSDINIKEDILSVVQVKIERRLTGATEESATFFHQVQLTF